MNDKTKKLPILLLHGWGKEGQAYSKFCALLQKKGYEVYSPDMPGFGLEKLPKSVLTLSDYVEFVKKYLQQKNITKVIIIGHSFGGRVAAKFAVIYPEYVEKIIFTGAPLIKRRLSKKKRLISFFIKMTKTIEPLVPSVLMTRLRKSVYLFLGEFDYYKAGPLKETFKQIIGEDVSPVLPKISVPVLLIWGEDDTLVPVSDGREIAKLIPGSHIVVLPHETHKLPYENPQRFFNAVETFL